MNENEDREKNYNRKQRFTISLAEWYEKFALEIEMKDDDSFLKIRETLTRVGVSSAKDKKLFQSCHILSKKNKYYIVHFKELFALDGRPVDLSEEDIKRRNTIAFLLASWELFDISIDSGVQNIEENCLPITAIKIIKHNEKSKYELIAKYQIGNNNGYNKKHQEAV